MPHDPPLLGIAARQAVRRGRWKAVPPAPGETPTLFDLETTRTSAASRRTSPRSGHGGALPHGPHALEQFPLPAIDTPIEAGADARRARQPASGRLGRPERPRVRDPREPITQRAPEGGRSLWARHHLRVLGSDVDGLRGISLPGSPWASGCSTPIVIPRGCLESRPQGCGTVWEGRFSAR